MKDDLDYEEQTRSRKSKDGIVSMAVMQALAPLVMMDTAKNSLLSKDHKVIEQMRKSVKDYPQSAFENNVEGIDVITSHFPEFSAENSGLAATAGMGLDFLDPLSYGVSKIGTKAGKALTISNKVGKHFSNKADDYAEEFVQKLIKKKDMDQVPNITNYIKKNELRGKLSDPEALIQRLEGKRELVNEGTLAHPVYKSNKTSEGTLDKVGQDIVRTTRLADAKGAAPVNRGDIFRQMKRAITAKNADDTVSGVVKVDPYAGKLQEVLKPFEKRKVIDEGIAPAKPTAMPPIPDGDLESTINNLFKEADGIKKAKGVQAAQASERTAAEKMAIQKADREAADKVSSATQAKKSVEGTKAAQKAEREAAEKKVAQENQKITGENAKVDQTLLNLLLKRKSLDDKIDPMDSLPVPSAQKGLPPIPAKEVLDIQLHNKKAAIANKRYLEQGELKTELPSLEEQIAMLKNTERKPLKEVDVPPVMPDEAFSAGDKPYNSSSVRLKGVDKDGKPVFEPYSNPAEYKQGNHNADIDVPPAIPNEAIGRNLEDVLAELSDKQLAKKNLGNTNSKIAKENTENLKNYGLEARAAAPKTRIESFDRISKLEDMWRLKKSARDNLKEADFDANIKNLPEHKRMVLTAAQEIDNKIVESLKDINFPEGNAGDIYLALNDDFGTQADFLELIVDETINQWKGGKIRGGALPALTGGIAAAIASKTSGGSIPLSVIAGGVAGESVKRGWGMTPATKAKVADRMSQDFPTHLATQAGMEAVEGAAEITGLTPSKLTAPPERDIEEGQKIPQNADDVEVDMSNAPEDYKRLMEGGRSPQSEAPVQDDLSTKIDETLTPPPRPQWDPYVNEDILNTQLPRDSKRLLANPTALLAKLQQVAPNQVPLFKEMLDKDPEAMTEAAPKMAMMFPAVFEKDKYGMFDGKILDPVMQEKFLLDLSEDEDLDSIEKANISMKIRRGVSIHE